LKSPTAGCGKSTLLDIIECLVNKPLTPSNITGASLFRVIAEHRPTILLDEADRYAKDNADLISVVNAGHKKNGTVVRCTGDDQEVRAFSVWAPMAIAAISSLTGTVEDRSVMIVMQRKPPGLKLRRFRADRPPPALGILASQAARWVADNQAALGNADPLIPETLSNRAADNWLPLLAIAEAAGGDWPERAAKAAAAAVGEDDGLTTRLLADIEKVFTDDALHSAGLVALLVELEDSPWSEANRGRPLTANRLARMLKDFCVQPLQIRIGNHQRRGYRGDQFDAAFAAYLPATSAQGPQPPSATVTTATTLEDNEKSAFATVTPDSACDGLKSEIPQQGQGCSGCDGSSPASGHVGGDRGMEARAATAAATATSAPSSSKPAASFTPNAPRQTMERTMNGELTRRPARQPIRDVQDDKQFRISGNWALASDGVQWIVQKWTGSKWRGVKFMRAASNEPGRHR
jgi:hypothetical protein